MLFRSRASQQLHALQQLMQAEQELSAAPTGWTQMTLASHPAVQPAIDVNGVPFAKMAEVLRGLADAGVVLSVRDFLALTVKSANVDLVNAVTNALPNFFSKLASEEDIVSTLENNKFYPADHASPAVRLWAEKVAATHSLLTHNVEKRAYLAVIRDLEPAPLQPHEKRASSNAETALAKHYALYKIAAFSVASEKYRNNLLTANQCVLQNYVT